MQNLKTRFFSTLLACVVALTGVAAFPAVALADVRSTDIVYGEAVDVRGLSASQVPNVEAEYVYVMGSDGTVYFERNATTSAQIASITKVMTAVVVLDAVNAGLIGLDTPVTISAAAAQVGESSAGLIEGDVVDVQTALTALMVSSGNDAGVALAETVGALLITQGIASGDSPEAAFVSHMTTTAANLGCVDTVYNNPHGLDFDEFAGDLHSTASDQALVVQYAMKNEVFRSIVAQHDATLQINRNGTTVTQSISGTDVFLQIYEYAIGVKTGFTALAGQCFAGASNNGEVELYAIVLNSSTADQRFVDAQILCEWVYEHLVAYPLANSPSTTTMNGVEVPVIAEISHEAWIDKTVKATLLEPDTAIEIFDLNGNISQEVEFYELTSDVRVGEVVGSITFKQRNEVVATMDLVACESVEAPNFFESIGIWWERFFLGFSGSAESASSVVLNETPLVLDKSEG